MRQGNVSGPLNPIHEVTIPLTTSLTSMETNELGQKFLVFVSTYRRNVNYNHTIFQHTMIV